jgi:hypothetical protein
MKVLILHSKAMLKAMACLRPFKGHGIILLSMNRNNRLTILAHPKWFSLFRIHVKLLFFV